MLAGDGFEAGDGFVQLAVEPMLDGGGQLPFTIGGRQRGAAGAVEVAAGLRRAGR